MTHPQDTTSEVVARLNAVWRDGDHERLCQGREYNCTCGFDGRTEATAREAAALISSLVAERDEARAEVVAEQYRHGETGLDLEALTKRVGELEGALGPLLAWTRFELDPGMQKKQPWLTAIARADAALTGGEG